MSCKKCIFFDVDGTLLDSAAFNEASLKETLKMIGEDENLTANVRKYFGLPGIEFLQKINIPNPQEVFDLWKINMEHHTELLKVYDGIIPLLEKLWKNNYEMAVVTSRTFDIAKRDLQSLGLLKYFSFSVTADDTEKHKPDPQPLVCGLVKSGRKAEECVYIGDTIVDCLCSKNASVPFLLAGWGALAVEGMEEERILSSPDQLEEYLGL